MARANCTIFNPLTHNYIQNNGANRKERCPRRSRFQRWNGRGGVGGEGPYDPMPEKHQA